MSSWYGVVSMFGMKIIIPFRSGFHLQTQKPLENEPIELGYKSITMVESLDDCLTFLCVARTHNSILNEYKRGKRIRTIRMQERLESIGQGKCSLSRLTWFL